MSLLEVRVHSTYSVVRCAGFFIFLLVFTSCSPQCTPGTQSLSNRVVIQVDDSEMSAQEFASRLAERLKNYDALAVKEDRILSKAKQDIVRDFILKVLTENWAQSNQVILRKEDIDAQINDIRNQYPDDLTFRQKLIEENLTYEEWLEKMKFSLLQNLVMKKLIEDTKPPEQSELKAYYESNKDLFKKARQVKLRQIVLKNENDAKSIRSEIHKKKKQMEDLAPKFSIAPEGLNKGELGWVEEGTLEVFDKVFDQPTGYLSGVLKSPYGYHIIKVLDKRNAMTVKFEDVKDKIYKVFIQNREQAAYSKWLENEIRKAKVMKDEAFIENIKIETRDEY